MQSEGKKNELSYSEISRKDKKYAEDRLKNYFS